MNFKARYTKKYGVSGFNKPKKTPNHPTKSHIVVTKVGDRVKVIRFGQQGVSGSPKKEGESAKDRNRRTQKPDYVSSEIKKVSEVDLKKALMEVKESNRKIRESFRVDRETLAFRTGKVKW